VWDYPRPPRIEATTRHVVVEFAGATVADSRRALRVLETAGAPCIYLPNDDVRMDLLGGTETSTFCEWKGTASYFDVTVGDRVARDAAWTYRRPTAGYELLRDHVAFYPGRVDSCFLDGEPVRPQPGSYYGGWVTNDIVGPFKGEEGTADW
jgi:uncharacterized protein (DUF427 family)